MFNNCDSKTNGEYDFFKRIEPHIQVIFDIGCRSDSEFTNFEREVHYFDPMPQFIDTLSKMSNKNSTSYFTPFNI
jgi:hypothetical protein